MDIPPDSENGILVTCGTEGCLGDQQTIVPQESVDISPQEYHVPRCRVP